MSETTTTNPQSHEADLRSAQAKAPRPGNPFAREMADRHRALLSVWTPEALVRMGQKIIELAEQGSVSAMRLALAYGIGRPRPVVDTDRLDLEEWKLYREEGACYTDLAQVGQMPGLAAPLAAVRAFRPLVEDMIYEQMLKEVKAPGVGKASPSPNGEKMNRKQRRQAARKRAREAAERDIAALLEPDPRL